MTERAAAAAPTIAVRARRAAVQALADRPLVLASGLAATAAAGLAWASIFRHQHLGSNAYDLGIFDQTIWGYSRFEMLPNTVVRLPNLLGDHFHPVLIALAPLYWLWDDARVLLVAQAALLAAASLPLFLWARRELGTAAALLFQAAFLVSWPVLGGNIFDFHELAVAAPIVALALYAVLTRNTRLLWVTVALALLTREDLALTFAALGIFVAVVQRRAALGVAVSAVSVAWFAIAYKLVIPAFADRSYTHWWYDALGSSPGDAAVQLVAHPVDSARLFFTPRDKQIAIFNLFAPWLALPLVSPLLLVTLPGLGARFFSDNPSHWAPQGFHYSLVLVPILAFSAVDTTARLARVFADRLPDWFPVAAAGGILLAGLYFSFVRLKPLDELRRYATAAQIEAARSCLETIPAGSSVSATSALVPHLSHRRRIYVLDRRPLPQTEYYVLDRATWIYPLTQDDLRRLEAERRRKGYRVTCARGSTVVLARAA